MSSNGAKQAFKQRVRHWAQQLEVPIAWLAVRPMRHKWASCSTSGHLHFSADLLPLDSALWDYVIVHELLHLSVPNHGRLWKALMRAHLGDWEAAAARLQRPRSAGPADQVELTGSCRQLAPVAAGVAEGGGIQGLRQCPG